ncbi:uncharacterized protein LOC111884862 [Lactuca sativa]|uniref:uncharacterized protein LOC111884862 n=1 Tax=Lactuca sativa TaxID=4236 RepID=UPI000CD94F04|nr:uncharacterized protein LOC111884862 [Lactuca sativa]
MKKKRDAIEREISGPSTQIVTRSGTLIRCGICKEPGHNKKKCPSNQQSNTSIPSSSKGSGAGPSSSRGSEGPSPVAQPPPPPRPAAQPPPPPPAVHVPRRRAQVGRSGKRKYFERIIKQAVLQNVRGFRKKKWLKEYGRSREKNKRTQLTDLTNIYEIKSRKPTVTSRGSSAYKPTISHGHVDKQRVINLAK